MEEKETFKQIDADILQSKADIFRAQQEGLGMKASTPEKPLPAALRPLDQIRVGEARLKNLPEPDEPENLSDQDNLKDLSQQMQEELTRTAFNEEGENSHLVQMEKDIPRFNLAEQILVEQRRAAAQRRQKSGSTNGIGSALNDRGIHQVVRAINQPSQRQTQTFQPKATSQISERKVSWPDEIRIDDTVITQIVASDIARFCRKA
ncbi:MAG: hypothetical protein JXA82_11305 [Sedimentisphaerales bacterium]|nr:hypothetical protein [Sedimentisphaerales bacterium]